MKKRITYEKIRVNLVSRHIKIIGIKMTPVSTLNLDFSARDLIIQRGEEMQLSLMNCMLEQAINKSFNAGKLTRMTL